MQTATHVLVASLATFALALPACATTEGYVIKSVPGEVALQDSDFHSFEYVNLKRRKGQLVVYGKIRHDHAPCFTEGHVDLRVSSSGDATGFEASLPLRRGSHRARGWAGAAFRAELPYTLDDGARVRLAFHEDRCAKPASFRCRDGRAAASSRDSEWGDRGGAR